MRRFAFLIAHGVGAAAGAIRSTVGQLISQGKTVQYLATKKVKDL